MNSAHRHPQPRVRVTIRDRGPWHASRTSHAAALSALLHIIFYVVLGLEWMRRVPVVEVRPLLDDASIEVAFLPASDLDVAVATIEPSAPSVAVVPIAAAVVSQVAPPQPAPDPPPQARPKAAPAPKEPTPPPEPPKEPPEDPPETPPPAVTSVETTARLTEPDDPVAPTQPASGEAQVEPAEAPVEASAPPSDEEPTAAPADVPAAVEVARPSEPQGPLTPAQERRVQIGRALTSIARAASGGAQSRAVDVVFLLDLSGSMQNNLRAVGESLSLMMTQLRNREIDATFGVVKFKSALFLVFPQTADITAYERLLANLRVGGDELALNALSRAAEKVQFRPHAQRRFVLVTDEPLKGEPPLAQLVPQLIKARIVVDVIGLDVRDHKMLARATGGTWHRIPGDKS